MRWSTLIKCSIWISALNPRKSLSAQTPAPIPSTALRTRRMAHWFSSVRAARTWCQSCAVVSNGFCFRELPGTLTVLGFAESIRKYGFPCLKNPKNRSMVLGTKQSAMNSALHRFAKSCWSRCKLDFFRFVSSALAAKWLSCRVQRECRERETERQRDRETERQRDRETERQRGREAERQRESSARGVLWLRVAKNSVLTGLCKCKKNEFESLQCLFRYVWFSSRVKFWHPSSIGSRCKSLCADCRLTRWLDGRSV